MSDSGSGLGSRQKVYSLLLEGQRKVFLVVKSALHAVQTLTSGIVAIQYQD